MSLSSARSLGGASYPLTDKNSNISIKPRSPSAGAASESFFQRFVMKSRRKSHSPTPSASTFAQPQRPGLLATIFGGASSSTQAKSRKNGGADEAKQAPPTTARPPQHQLPPLAKFFKANQISVVQTPYETCDTFFGSDEDIMNECDIEMSYSTLSTHIDTLRRHSRSGSLPEHTYVLKTEVKVLMGPATVQENISSSDKRKDSNLKNGGKSEQQSLGNGSAGVSGQTSRYKPNQIPKPERVSTDQHQAIQPLRMDASNLYESNQSGATRLVEIEVHRLSKDPSLDAVQRTIGGQWVPNTQKSSEKSGMVIMGKMQSGLCGGSPMVLSPPGGSRSVEQGSVEGGAQGPPGGTTAGGLQSSPSPGGQQQSPSPGGLQKTPSPQGLLSRKAITKEAVRKALLDQTRISKILETAPPESLEAPKQATNPPPVAVKNPTSQPLEVSTTSSNPHGPTSEESNRQSQDTTKMNSKVEVRKTEEAPEDPSLKMEKPDSLPLKKIAKPFSPKKPERPPADGAAPGAGGPTATSFAQAPAPAADAPVPASVPKMAPTEAQKPSDTTPDEPQPFQQPKLDIVEEPCTVKIVPLQYSTSSTKRSETPPVEEAPGVVASAEVYANKSLRSSPRASLTIVDIEATPIPELRVLHHDSRSSSSIHEQLEQSNLGTISEDTPPDAFDLSESMEVDMTMGDVFNMPIPQIVIGGSPGFDQVVIDGEIDRVVPKNQEKIGHQKEEQEPRGKTLEKTVGGKEKPPASPSGKGAVGSAAGQKAIGGKQQTTPSAPGATAKTTSSATSTATKTTTSAKPTAQKPPPPKAIAIAQKPSSPRQIATPKAAGSQQAASTKKPGMDATGSASKKPAMDAGASKKLAMDASSSKKESQQTATRQAAAPSAHKVEPHKAEPKKTVGTQKLGQQKPKVEAQAPKPNTEQKTSIHKTDMQKTQPQKPTTVQPAVKSLVKPTATVSKIQAPQPAVSKTQITKPAVGFAPQTTKPTTNAPVPKTATTQKATAEKSQAPRSALPTPGSSSSKLPQKPPTGTGKSTGAKAAISASGVKPEAASSEKVWKTAGVPVSQAVDINQKKQ